MTPDSSGVTPGVDLYWLPLGAGGHVVKRVGRVSEALQASREHRQTRTMFHSALVVHVDGTRFVVEQVPAPRRPVDRGVVCTGPVAVRWGSRWPLPRYEVHCWRDGVIADVAEAVASPVRVAGDAAACHKVLASLADLPAPTWGRDELHAGGMWNSNSVIAWLLARGGVDTSVVRPPAGGTAPGWEAGLIVEGRTRRQERPPPLPRARRN